MALMLLPFSAFAWAISDVDIDVSKSIYAPNEMVLITGTVPAKQDITMKVIFNGGVVYVDAIPAADNDGSISFSTKFGLVGLYTVVVGSGANPVDMATFEVKSSDIDGGIGGDTGGAIVTPEGSIYENVKNSTNLLVEQLGTLGSNSTAQQIRDLIAELLPTLQSNLQLLSSIEDSAQRVEAFNLLTSVMKQIGDKVVSVSDTSSVISMLESVFLYYGEATRVAEQINLDNTEIKQSTVSLATLILSRVGTVGTDSLIITDSSSSFIVSVEGDAIAGIIERLLDGKKRLAGVLNQQKLATEELDLYLTLSINLDAAGNVDLSLSKEQVDKLKASGISLVVQNDTITIALASGAIPTLDENTVSLALRFHTPNQLEEIINKQPGYISSVNLPVKDFHLVAIDANGNETSLSDQFLGDVKVSFLLDGIDKSKLDLDKLAVYYYNETTAKWEIISAKYNAATNAMDYLPKHFSTYTVVQVNKSFADITGRWSQRVIEVAYAKGILSGKSESSFDPSANVTRAEFATMLVNTLGLTGSGKAKFSDVAASAWYADAVSAAYESGLVTGVDETHFAPNAKITREQMATMIGRALTFSKSITPATAADIVLLSKFTDHNLVSAWASEWVALVVKEEIMNGVSATSLAPKVLATREQAAKLMLDLFNY